MACTMLMACEGRRHAQRREEIRTAYHQIRSELATKYPDWMKASEDAAFAPLLNRAWPLVGEWAATYLEAHPEASADEIARAITALNPPRNCKESKDKCLDAYDLDTTAVQLLTGKDAAYAVSTNFPHSGTLFVVARTETGRFRVAWNIKDLAAAHYASKDEIGYWAYLDFSWGDGPLVGMISALVPSRNGRPRFYVDAWAAVFAGGTYPRQLSIWEWDGKAATPLLIKFYLASVETSGNEVVGDLLRVHTKGAYETFISCGMCREPEVIWTVRVTPDGVQDLGREHVLPELQMVDELWVRVTHGQSAADIASPQVVRVIRQLISAMRREEGGTDPDLYLGMLFERKIVKEDNREVLHFSAENLCSELRFEIDRSKGRPYFTRVHLAHPCE